MASITQNPHDLHAADNSIGGGSADQAARSRLKELYAPIASDLVRVESMMKTVLTSDVDFIAELVQRVQLYGGKRLRPALLLLAGRAAGGVNDDHIKLASCVELIHVATLVHDDVLDESELRRHTATVNAEWGTEPSLLLGDFLFTHAFQLAADASTAEACRWLGRTTNRVCEGELHQVSRRGAFELSEAEHLDMLEGKTAELFSCACGLGALYAGASADWIEALSNYGRRLGVAFQIADDMLDILGDAATTGKTVGSDLRKQKMTLPLIYLRETANEADRQALREAFESPTPAAFELVRGLLQRSDALERTRRRGVEFVESAVESLAPLPDVPATRSLRQIAEYALQRSA